MSDPPPYNMDLATSTIAGVRAVEFRPERRAESNATARLALTAQLQGLEGMLVADSLSPEVKKKVQTQIKYLKDLKKQQRTWADVVAARGGRSTRKRKSRKRSTRKRKSRKRSARKRKSRKRSARKR
jgi:hypothetical protein